jgi:hypothetical protein
MSWPVKLLIGLSATILMGWVWHGPMGNGAKLIDAIEGNAKAAVAGAGLPGIEVRLDRDPLSRRAILSGPADSFQRQGMGSEPGLTGIVAGVKGVGSVRWADEGGATPGMPLLAETLILLVLAFLIGIGCAWLLWGRPKRETYL